MADAGKYPIEVFYSEEDEGYIAIARDLPGCSAFGSTHAEAVIEIQQAIEAWKLAAANAGNPIPEPTPVVQAPLPSGKLLLRLPRSLHATLLELAKKEDVSLNQYLVSTLSASSASQMIVSDYASRMLSIVKLDRSIAEQKAFFTTKATNMLRTRYIRDHEVSSGAGHFLRVVVSEPALELNFGSKDYDIQSLPAGVPVIRREER